MIQPLHLNANSREKMLSEGPQRETISPLEASLDHIWTTLFHRLLKMDKGQVVGFFLVRRKNNN